MTTPYHALIAVLATRFSLDADLLEAQVIVESSGHADAFRFEAGIWSQLQRGALQPAVPLDLATVNPRRVASSYGLLQILYITALDYGHRDDPELLFVPERGLAMGCAHLRHLVAHFNGDLPSAIASYNGGIGGNGPTVTVKRNQTYLNKVIAVNAALKKASATA